MYLPQGQHVLNMLYDIILPEPRYIFMVCLPYSIYMVILTEYKITIEDKSWNNTAEKTSYY